MNDRKTSLTTGSNPSAAAPGPPAPPVAPKRPHRLEIHGHSRQDDYHWLRDDERRSAEVLAHLAAENRYTESALSPVAELREQLFEEIIARIDRDDASVPVQIDQYWYLTRYQEDQEHPVYARRRGAADGPEEIILDVNRMASGHDYYQVGNTSISDDHRLLVFAEDTLGRRQYRLRAKDLIGDTMLHESIPDTSGAIAWAADGATFFYVRRHPETLRPYRLYRHSVGTPCAEDRLVYEEQDDSFYATVYRGKSKQFIYLHLASTVADEVRLLAAGEPQQEFRIFLARERGHEYSVADLGGRFYVRSNCRAVNFRIMETSLASAGDPAAWREVIAHREDRFISDFDLFKDYLVVGERSEGLRRLRALPLAGGPERVIAAEEPAYTMSIDDNEDCASNVLRYRYSSMTTPDTVYDLDLDSGQRIVRKRQTVLGGFDPADYVTERIAIDAGDGTRIPVSLVYRRGLQRDGSRPLLIYAYGAYGLSMDPLFVSSRLSLLERGFVYALAHVRGGHEMGRSWYENGKLDRKHNTFTDFIQVTEGLVKRGYADPRRVYAMGGSAGGLLVGAVINAAPQLYHGVVAMVPFVDVLSTMLDESLPLTSGEFDEWGNPAHEEHYRLLLTYSPYDQVRAQAYPHMLVTSGLHDSQVQYWEPAKWVAKLRELKTDEHLLLLHTDMEAGHGGAAGRFEFHRDTALVYAFLLMLAEDRR